MEEDGTTELRVLFDGADVTADVGADLLSFAYTDRESDEADELRLTLMDPTGKWASSWRPDGGEKVRASIITDDGWLPCGEFTVDSLEYSGSPRVLEIGAVSVPLDTPIRRKAKTRAWEKMGLRAIAEKLTTEAGMKLMWEAGRDTQEYERINQNRKSDLKFLMRLCRDNGLSLKVTDGTIVIFDRQSYDKKTPVGSIVPGESAVLSWSFSRQKGQTYRTCRVSYRNPAKKTKTSAASYYNADFEKVSVKPVKKSGNPAVMEFTAEDEAVDGQEFELRKMASSRAERRKGLQGQSSVS